VSAYRNLAARSPVAHARFTFRHLLSFGRAYWDLLVPCVPWYAVILAFRSTFSIKYFQHWHGLDLTTADAYAPGWHSAHCCCPLRSRWLCRGRRGGVSPNWFHFGEIG
jgi:hypothetical protein